MAAYFYETLTMAGRLLVPTNASSNGALDPTRWGQPEPGLADSPRLWFSESIRDATITPCQRLLSLGLRYLDDLIVEIVPALPPTESNPCAQPAQCILTGAATLEQIFGGAATGAPKLTLGNACTRMLFQLLDEIVHSATARNYLTSYANSHADAPEHVRLAILMNSELGSRPAIIDAARVQLPAGCARARPLDKDTGSNEAWTARRTESVEPTSKCRADARSQLHYLVRTAANLWCGSEGQWLTCS
jgi:hypothetical protein